MTEKLSSKMINNSYLGVYKIFKVLEQLKRTSYDEVKNKKDISAYVYDLYEKLKNEFHVKTDAQLQDQLNNDPSIQSNVKAILNGYFDSALGIQKDLKNGDLLDSMFIEVICKGLEYKSHLHYKFAGIYTYQDFESPKMDPSKFIHQLISNLKPIYIQKEEVDERISKKFGIDDKIDNIKLLRKYAKISELGFVLNTCHNYSPGQHWVAMCMQLLESKNKRKYFKLFYYDSQMAPAQQQTIGFQLEPLDCDAFPNCPPEYKNYVPKVREWLQKLATELDKNKIEYHHSSKSAVKVNFNKNNTQQDDYSCGYHSILFNYLMSINGEALDSIQASLSKNSSLDSIISSFREMLIRKQDLFGQSRIKQSLEQNSNQNSNTGAARQQKIDSQNIDTQNSDSQNIDTQNIDSQNDTVYQTVHLMKMFL